ncbi:MAG: PEP-CTERM sorting domain-containing protein [Verrucomicrobiae bacterium]|nr:PEP-CTERM sorting domain-containing protein [Verrucomicrobiae bacterium]NNJ87752.1 PEP-CTERM sorting domain-containing protein [Akkermansiaceae bacterium]
MISLKRSILVFSLAFSPSAWAVLALQSYNADKHSRFENDPAFIGASNDWSGVARASNGRWVTMISSTYFITANHAAPSIGNTVVFHEDNNPGGSTVTRTVSSRTRISNTDLVIGRLNSAPGATIAIYGIASNTTDEANFASSVYADKIAYAVGKDNTGTLTTEFRVGRNELDGFYDDVEAEGYETVSGSLTAIGDAITFDDDRGTPESLGDDEAYLQSGDSGAPLFVTLGDELVLTGINWFIAGPPDVTNQLSGTTFVPNYIAEIQTILDSGGESLTLVSVPEPSSVVLLCLSGLALLRRHR